jgi:hypothetical protein
MHSRFVLKVVVWGNLAALTAGCAAQDRPAGLMPKPQAVNAQERQVLLESVRKQFGDRLGEKPEVRAAGAYRFAGGKESVYISRKDLGSVAFESASYGAAKYDLDKNEVSQERLLPRIDAALERAGLKVPDRKFAWFQDEFAGAAPKGKESIDPREHAKLVARTAAFTRSVDGVPIFGSELLVGLDPDGQIGRLRLHWPRIEPSMLRQARGLQEMVESKKWRLPKGVESEGTEILETIAGVGHSAFADPHFKATPVVRVLVRRVTRETQYPLQSTAYKYFDASGREVQFSAFPKIPGTPAARKPKVETKGKE